MLTSDTQLVVNEYGELEEVCVKCAIEANSWRCYCGGPDFYEARDWRVPDFEAHSKELEVKPCRFCNYGGPGDAYYADPGPSLEETYMQAYETKRSLK